MGQNAKYMNQIIFHEKDKALSVVGQHNYICRWELPTYKKVYESKLEQIKIYEEGTDVVREVKHQIRVEYI